VKLNRKVSLLLLLLSLTGCGSIGFPGVYKLTIQQGNIVSQEMIDKLKPGMTRAQIQFVLGNPVLADLLTASGGIIFTPLPTRTNPSSSKSWSSFLKTID